MDLRPYTADALERWNAFVDASKNGTFLLRRDYAEYHAHRFQDASLLVHEGNDLIALLPANRVADTLETHGGLTYGGFVTDENMTITAMLAVFREAKRYLQERGISQVRYKCVPYIYHRLPAEEDLYALHVNEAKLVRRDVLSVVSGPDKIPWSERRRRALKKANRAGIVVRESDDLDAFWRALRENLSMRHDAKPVHDEAEMKLLRSRFPENIRLFAGFEGETLAGGVLVYESPRVAHAQYIATTPSGRELGCLDAVFDHLLSVRYRDTPFFDFGSSTEDGGMVLNEGLVTQKEGFGARTVVHDHYEWNLGA
jgi:hypothetical protein